MNTIASHAAIALVAMVLGYTSSIVWPDTMPRSVVHVSLSWIPSPRGALLGQLRLRVQHQAVSTAANTLQLELGSGDGIPFDGALDDAPASLLNGLIDALGSTPEWLNGISLRECFEAHASSNHDASACLPGNGADAVALCHGRTATGKWPHRSMAQIYTAARQLRWLHIDNDRASSPDLVRDVTAREILVSPKYLPRSGRACILRDVCVETDVDQSWLR